jgi:hypothetical protein
MTEIDMLGKRKHKIMKELIDSSHSISDKPDPSRLRELRSLDRQISLLKGVAY